MTEAAAARRGRARSRRVVAAVAVAASLLALALAAWLLLIRDSGPSPGPLANPETASIGIFQHPGDEFGFGLAVAYNTGDEPAVLKRIRLVEPTPGLEVIDTKVGGPDRELLALDATFTWPSDEFTDQHPVAGFSVAPMSEPDGDRGVELLFGLRVGGLGSYESRAVAVEYTVGDDEHVAYIRQGVKICVVPESQPLEGDCGYPDRRDAPIDEDL